MYNIIVSTHNLDCKYMVDKTNQELDFFVYIQHVDIPIGYTTKLYKFACPLSFTFWTSEHHFW